MAEEFDSVLLVVREVHVYRLGPRSSSRGYRASDWDVSQHLWSGRLRIVAKADNAVIRLEDAGTGELFAMCPYDPDSYCVEPVVDSSRYFSLRIVDPGSGKHTYIGLGFPERDWAFDFNVALQEHATRVKRGRETTKSNNTKVDSGPAVDYSLKAGETFSINLGSGPTKKDRQSAPSSAASTMPLPFLPPPPSGVKAASLFPAQQQQHQQQPQANAFTAFAPTQASAPFKTDDWADFGDFVGTSSSPSPASNPTSQPQPSSSSGQNASVPNGWTTF
ncbi:adaptin ear-binding coat-associated protein 2-like protein [Phlyctochytrium arcticum]|nr:adaptin ear-binding coat-associated protein 2-like protein [Phlyctochytrium arcticum]